MKQLVILTMIICAACSNVSQKNDAELSFSKTELDLGVLQYKYPKTVNFEVQNSGETSLVLFDVKTNCGCTVPTWDKKPIKSGKTGSIEVTFDSDFPGIFRKTIIVFYNGLNSPDTLLIKGEVEYPEELSNKE